MKNSTIYKIFGVLTVIVLFAFGVIMTLFPYKPANQPNQNQPSQGTISIPTAKGNVETRDFTKAPVEKTNDTIAFKETPDYHIVYFSKDKTFLITILSQPVQKARDGAEAEFLNALQISKGDACKLNVALTVPFDVDQNLAGKDWALSFCPNGVQF